jgi:hypothetical protein
VSPVLNWLSFIVRVVLLGPAHGLLQQRVCEATLHSTVTVLSFVADNGALQNAFWHDLVSLRASPFTRFSRMIVLIRAMSRRTCRTRAVFSS